MCVYILDLYYDDEYDLITIKLYSIHCLLLSYKLHMWVMYWCKHKMYSHSQVLNHSFTVLRYCYVLLDVVFICNPTGNWNDSVRQENVSFPETPIPGTCIERDMKEENKEI